MVNATEMAKAFDKRPIDWLQNKQTEEFLNELSKVRKSTLADLVQVTRGGDNPGTWMHEDVAMEFITELAALRNRKGVDYRTFAQNGKTDTGGYSDRIPPRRFLLQGGAHREIFSRLFA